MKDALQGIVIKLVCIYPWQIVMNESIIYT